MMAQDSTGQKVEPASFLKCGPESTAPLLLFSTHGSHRAPWYLYRAGATDPPLSWGMHLRICRHGDTEVENRLVDTVGGRRG